MAGRSTGLRKRKNKSQVGAGFHKENLDYHEGLSANQVKIVLREFGLEHKLDRFNEWMSGQTCPIVQRYNQHNGKLEQTGGIYEYDLFRWVENQKKGTSLIWD